MPTKTTTASDALHARVATVKTIGIALALSLMAVLIIGMQAYKKFTIEPERAISKCYFQMYVMDKKEKQCKIMNETFTFTPEVLLKNYGDRIDKVKNIIYTILGVGFIALIFLTIGFYKLLSLLDRGKNADVFLRGARKATNEELTRMLIKEKKASSITLGDVPIVEGSETTHFMISGATGVGKSVAIKELLDHARANGQRAIVYDPSGEFVEAYYREGIDLIMNPFDERSPAWNIFADIHNEFDFADVVNSLIPLPQNSNDPFWINAPRDVLEAMLRYMMKEKNYSNEYLYKMLTQEPIRNLHALLQGEAGASHIDPSNEKSALSIRSALMPYIKPFKYLKEGKETPFSLKNYVADDTVDHWVFIRIDMDQLNALRPLVSLWLDLAITATLSLPIDPDRRLWYVIDELATLQRINKIKDLLDKGRKCGACTVLGLQNISQIKEAYGREGATSMITNCKTWLIYNTPDSETAKYLSDNIGNAEVLATKFSQSESVDGRGGGSQSTNTNYQTEKKAVIMPEEIMYLPDLTAYLKIAGDFPVTQIKFEWKARPTIAEKFVPAGKGPPR